MGAFVGRGNEITSTELWGEHAALASARVKGMDRATFTRRLTNSADYIESPAEAVFLLWFWAEAEADWKFWISPQRVVECYDGSAYRIDFVVLRGDEQAALTDKLVNLKIAVEIDGHAFHEKTLYQVTHRNARDRALQASGWRVFHFSFSELVKNPLACVHEVVTAAVAASKAAVTH